MIDQFPFYKHARELWEQTQEKQITKGLHKYEEPFNPASWTSEELLDHALQESVDLVHYIVGLKEQNTAAQREIAMLKAELAIARFRLDNLSHGITEYKKPSYLDLDDTF